MVAMVSWPTVTDDDGSLVVGTPWSNAVAAAIKASVEDQVHSPTNPTLKPFETTDEVVDARGSKASLGAWGLVGHNADGTHVAVPQLAIPQNLLTDSLFNNWAAGDAVAPNGWTLAGAGAAVIRCGSGAGAGEAAPPADGTKMAWGDFCAKLTYGAAACYLLRNVIVAADFPDGLRGRKITFAVRCTTSTGSLARLSLSDGVSSNLGPYHAGDGVEAWITVTRTLDAAATLLNVFMHVELAGNAHFGAGVLVQGEWTPTAWFPEPTETVVLNTYAEGNAAVDAVVINKLQRIHTAGIAREFIFQVGVSPTGAALIYVPKKGTSAIFATAPQIDAAGGNNLTNGVGDRPDGTYANRCFARGDYSQLQCTQVGSGVAGADVDSKLVVVCPKNVMDILVL